MAEEIILPLLKSQDLALVGGKAVSLCRLINAGFRVPEGFVVTTKANPGNLEPALKEFDKLNTDKVAVRSSAVAEDGANDAWAGQMDTFLNVTRSDLAEKIKACFESSGSNRARAYASQKNIEAGKVAVIVQRMVPAQYSGVAFSAHPITNDKTQIVIESVPGLGEKLVSGSVTPDTYVANKSTGDIVEKHLAGTKPILNDLKVHEVNKTVKKIEELFGFPVDVEWAYSAGQLFILQSRPITTLS